MRKCRNREFRWTLPGCTLLLVGVALSSYPHALSDSLTSAGNGQGEGGGGRQRGRRRLWATVRIHPSAGYDDILLRWAGKMSKEEYMH